MAAEHSPGSSPFVSDEERERLILEHVGLVHYVVGRVAVRLPESVEREDLESAGLMGLIKAADRFDPARGVKFATYASSVVRGEIMETLRARDWAPRSVRRRYRQLERAIAELQIQLKRQPTEEEIRRTLGLSEEEYRELLSATSCMAVSSLEELMEQEETLQVSEADRPLEPSASDDDPARIVDGEALKELIAEAVDQLPERDRIVIGLYYQDELTLREIGEVLDVTESRVCQIHTQAITRLRVAVQSKLAA
ncbi:MAG TPA: FliA/WhiG family RNA polymerase sigma factor [Armatimonadota bacterium]|nr:FliA/WhiG family RNA polymerase sigma factor [Armatimonadota bacterium]